MIHKENVFSEHKRPIFCVPQFPLQQGRTFLDLRKKLYRLLFGTKGGEFSSRAFDAKFYSTKERRFFFGKANRDDIKQITQIRLYPLTFFDNPYDLQKLSSAHQQISLFKNKRK